MNVFIPFLMVLSIQGSGLRIVVSVDSSIPFMGQEKDYSELLEEGGVDLDLNTFAWAGNLEVIGDVTDKLRMRGSAGIRTFMGSYGDVNPSTYILLGLLTGGIGFLLPPEEKTIALMDREVIIEASLYYKLSSDSPVFSVGGGPMLAFLKRDLECPNSSMEGKGFGLGFNAGIRIDTEPEPYSGCLPIVFGAEAGFRYNKVTISGGEADDFQVDFSGPYVRLGLYLGLVEGAFGGG